MKTFSSLVLALYLYSLSLSKTYRESAGAVRF